MSTIPASELVNVQPSVLSPGGTSLDIIGLMLTDDVRAPIGQVLQFADQPSVAAYFGASSVMARKAGIYFGGFVGANKIPAALLAAQYNPAAVAAYLRGGSVAALTLAQLQAINGTLTVTMDGYARAAGSVNLSAATSFSSAATIIQTALNAADPTEATVTAAIGATFTGTQSGTNLTTTAVTGLISVGDTITGTGYAASTKIVSQTSGSAGGAGVYVTSVSGTASSAASVASSNVLNVTVDSGVVAIGQYVTGAGVTSVPITALGTGTGGVGTYIIAGAPQQVASESMTLTATPLTVTYDSVSGAFILTSGITGVASTSAFATGTIAATLLLTSATGAVISQGAVAQATAALSAAFMNALIQVNGLWATFMTTFDPDALGATGNTVKLALSAWKNTQNNRYGYVPVDTDVTPTASVPASSSMGQILAGNSDSGTCLIWQPDYTGDKDAFICGAAAAIDFTQTNGRISFAYKGQAGLIADVTTSTVAINLGGNPQASDRGNNYNFYGAYSTAGAAAVPYVWFQRGFVSGPYKWFDGYINQIWLNAGFQADLLTLQQNSKSIPYTVSGAGLIQAALNDRIRAALNFGMFAPGVLSASQIAQVNSAAGGVDAATTIQTQGYYLQIRQAAPTTRAARTSPPCTFWYLDGGSIQAINLASVALL